MKRSASRPIATAALAAAILMVYGLELVDDGMGLCQRFGIVAADPTLGTAMSATFLHDPSGIAHIAGNLAVLLLIGSLVERSLGPTRFAAVFLGGGLAGAAMHIIVDPTSTVPLVGASGSLFALLAVAGTLYGSGMLAFVAVLVLTNVAHALGAPGAAGVSFGAHLGGFVFGVLVVALARMRGSDSRGPRAARPVAA